MRRFALLVLLAWSFAGAGMAANVATSSSLGDVIVLRQSSPFSSGSFAGGSLYVASPGEGCRKLLELPATATQLFVSPDGRRLGYTLAEGLFVSGLNGSGRRLVAAHMVQVQGWVNPHRLVYREAAGGTTTIMAVTVGDSATAPTTLARDVPTADGVTLSPDGRYVTYRRTWAQGQQVSINIRRADGTGDRELYRGRAALAYMPDVSWSPNSKEILIADADALFMISVTGSGLRQLTHPMGDTDGRALSWSPDGTKIAFSRNRGPYAEVYVVNTDGSGLKRLTLTKAVPPPRWANGSFPGPWSPNGQAIAFRHNNDAAVLTLRPRTRSRTLCGASASGTTVYTPLAWRR